MTDDELEQQRKMYEARKWVQEWLWDCSQYGQERVTGGQPWTSPYVHDAAQMVTAARQEAEQEAARLRAELAEVRRGYAESIEARSQGRRN
jgi:hypothetical protein